MAGRGRQGSPLGRTLPALRDDFRGMSPLDDGGGRALSRFDTLEDRLNYQERTSQQLMEKAYKIKEQLLENLTYTHGTWQEEKTARELLQEHIRTITDVVRKLSREISSMEQQISSRSGMSDGTAVAVKNLEMSHVASITDLRGRVGRCDGSIAKLANDLKACFDAVKSKNQQEQERHQKIMDKLSVFDTKFNEVTIRLDRISTEHQLQLHHVEGESTGKISSLDAKTRQLIEETRNTMNTFKAMEASEREKMESRLVNHLDKLTNSRDVRTEKVEKRLDDHHQVLTKRIQRIEDEILKEKARVASVQTGLETKLNAAMDSNIKRQAGEIARLKKECREGFATLHETISHMKQVMDGKLKLLEEQLRKEIGQIRKMVVLI